MICEYYPAGLSHDLLVISKTISDSFPIANFVIIPMEILSLRETSQSTIRVDVMTELNSKICGSICSDQEKSVGGMNGVVTFIFIDNLGLELGWWNTSAENRIDTGKVVSRCLE
jgi:hypothetical protein